jgi:uncharacterized protein YciI
MDVSKRTSTCIAVLFLLLSCFSIAQQATPPEKDEKPTFQLETFYVAIMSKTQPFATEKAIQVVDEQQKYWQTIAEKGDLILGGPIASSNTLAAVFVLRAADKDTAAKVAQADPLVTQKLGHVALLPWGTQKDFLQPLKKYDPSVSYYLGFLKRGAKWTPEVTPETQRIQEAHLKNIGRLHEMGKLMAAGPFLEDTDLRGIFVFKTATIEEANELTNTDPAVQAGRLRIDLYEWKLPSQAFSPAK